MKFAEHLFTHLTSEWRSKYIHYDKMKEDLYAYVKDAPLNAEERAQYFAEKDDEFFDMCEREVLQINDFYMQQIRTAESRLRSLRNDMVSAYNQCAPSGIRLTSRVDSQRSLVDGDASFKSSRPRRTSSHSDTGHSAKARAIAAMSKEERYELINQVLTLPKYKKVHDSLRTAYSEFYLSLVLIQNFQELNATGFRKILKKHDKIFGSSSGHEWRVANVLSQEFVTDTKVNDLIAEVEKTYIIAVEGGDRTSAMKRLRVPPLSEKAGPWTTFRLGIFMGAFCILCTAICLTMGFKERRPNEPIWVPFRLFRGFLVFFLNLFLVGINHYGWQRAGVNNVLIFELDPRDHLNYQDIMELGAFFLVFWATCVVGYQYHDVLGIPGTVFPVILMCALLLWLLNPFKLAYYSARRWFIRKMMIQATPLCHTVLFADFWLADQLNSLVTFLLDMEYFACFYINEVDWTDMSIRPHNSTYGWGVNYDTSNDDCKTIVYGIRPVIAVIPAAIRFFQCIRRFADSRDKHPHLTNAGKYSTTFFVVLFSTLYSMHASNQAINESSFSSPFIYFWILSYLISTVYTYVWDVKMDWGLWEFQKVKKGSNKRCLFNKFCLRDSLLIYAHKWYYAAMVGDLILRLTWTLNVSLHIGYFSEHQEILVCVTALLECFRRFVWNFFRLENEHTNNCGQFRAVRDINVKVIPREELVGPEAEALMGRKPSVAAKLMHTFKIA